MATTIRLATKIEITNSQAASQYDLEDYYNSFSSEYTRLSQLHHIMDLSIITPAIKEKIDSRLVPFYKTDFITRLQYKCFVSDLMGKEIKTEGLEMTVNPFVAHTADLSLRCYLISEEFKWFDKVEKYILLKKETDIIYTVEINESTLIFSAE